MKKQKILYIIIAAAVVLLFLTQRKVLPNYYYSLLACGLGIYFFPVKMIQELIKIPKSTSKIKSIIVSIWSNYLYSYVICMSAMLLFSQDFHYIRIAAAISAMANGITGFVYFMGSINDEKAILHFLINMLYVTWI